MSPTYAPILTIMHPHGILLGAKFLARVSSPKSLRTSPPIAWQSASGRSYMHGYLRATRNTQISAEALCNVHAMNGPEGPRPDRLTLTRARACTNTELVMLRAVAKPTMQKVYNKCARQPSSNVGKSAHARRCCERRNCMPVLRKEPMRREASCPETL